MPQHDPEVCRAVKQWLDKAEQDLRASRIILQNDNSMGGIAAFHAQQAAEKSLKALLTAHQVEFSKTHDIGLLIELLSNHQLTDTEELRVAARLTDYAVETRYPGDIPEISFDEACQALELASNLMNQVSKLIIATK